MVSPDAQINNTRQSRLDKTYRLMRDRKAYLAPDSSSQRIEI
jgi:hypothetical protein